MSSSAEPLRITRRHLPHWSLAGATYFVTFRLRGKSLNKEEISLVKLHILSGHERYYRLLATQVMPDHVHIIFRPLPPYSLSRILKGIKGVTARTLNNRRGRKGSLWQDEYFDRIVKTQRDLLKILNYMLDNPLKAALTRDPWDYWGWYLNPQA